MNIKTKNWQRILYGGQMMKAVFFLLLRAEARMYGLEFLLL